MRRNRNAIVSTLFYGKIFLFEFEFLKMENVVEIICLPFYFYNSIVLRNQELAWSVKGKYILVFLFGFLWSCTISTEGKVQGKDEFN